MERAKVHTVCLHPRGLLLFVWLMTSSFHLCGRILQQRFQMRSWLIRALVHHLSYTLIRHHWGTIQLVLFIRDTQWSVISVWAASVRSLLRYFRGSGTRMTRVVDGHNHIHASSRGFPCIFLMTMPTEFLALVLPRTCLMLLTLQEMNRSSNFFYGQTFNGTFESSY